MAFDLKKLEGILEKHLKWVSGGKDGERANLSNADLRSINLHRVILLDADLYGVNFSNSDLSNADLYGANLRSANLYGANLHKANLSNADLYCANLSNADLGGVNLSYTNLRNANLSNADLGNANLIYADLYGANLSGANLYGANLNGKTLMSLYLIVPQEGPFVGYKKARSNIGDVILTVYIPRSAKRINSPTGRKCRAEKLKVIKVENMSGQEVKPEKIWSTHTNSFKYELGKWIKPDAFDDDFRAECTTGLHFFITKKEAKDY